MCHLPWLFGFKTGSLIALELNGWARLAAASHRDLLLSASPVLGLHMCATMHGFYYVGAGNHTQVLLLAKQTLYWLSHHPGSPMIGCGNHTDKSVYCLEAQMLLAKAALPFSRFTGIPLPALLPSWDNARWGGHGHKPGAHNGEHSAVPQGCRSRNHAWCEWFFILTALLLTVIFTMETINDFKRDHKNSV